MDASIKPVRCVLKEIISDLCKKVICRIRRRQTAGLGSVLVKWVYDAPPTQSPVCTHTQGAVVLAGLLREPVVHPVIRSEQVAILMSVCPEAGRIFSIWLLLFEHEQWAGVFCPPAGAVPSITGSFFLATIALNCANYTYRLAPSVALNQRLNDRFDQDASSHDFCCDSNNETDCDI